MNALKWWKQSTRMCFAEDSGGGSEAAPGSSGGDGGGGAGVAAPSSPSAAPASTPAPASAPPSGAAAEAFDWSALGSTDDLDYAEIPAEPPPAEPVAKVPPAEVPPAPAVQEPPRQAQPAAQQQPPGSEASRPLTAAEPWRIAEGLEANRDAVVAHLAQAKFALSEEDIKDLDTDVTVAVPKLLARVFLESQISMQKFLAQAVPGMVKQYNTVTSANDSAEKDFFAAHPALDINNPQHRATTVRIATVYRQANPTIPLKQLIAEVGPMVMTALRVNGGGQAAGASAPARSPPAFRPAVNGGGGLSPSPEPVNEWAGLGREYD
jgi:hypothetical protein